MTWALKVTSGCVGIQPFMDICYLEGTSHDNLKVTTVVKCCAHLLTDEDMVLFKDCYAWTAAAIHSSGFKPPSNNMNTPWYQDVSKMPGDYKHLVEISMPFYEKLYAHRFIPHKSNNNE